MVASAALAAGVETAAGATARADAQGMARVAVQAAWGET